ncbi:MAG: cytochrome c oxidase subunit II [Cyanobacteriota bacterium ELA615]
MNIPSNIITLIIGIALTLISLWYGQNHGLMPIAASDEAEVIDGIFDVMMTIGTGLFLLVQGILLYCMVRFRRRKGDTTDGPPIEGNVPLEILWTAIPAVVVFILAIYSFEVYNTMGGLDPHAAHDVGLHAHHSAPMDQKNMLALDLSSKDLAYGLGVPSESEDQVDLKVKVNAMQYAWIFNYPQGGIVTGELHVPVGKTVELEMEANDVIHAFWLPEFRIKQDVIPGRVTELVFTPNKVGQYPIVCAELCGAYHGGMKTVLYVQSPEDYQQWLKDNTVEKSESTETQKVANASPETEFLLPHVKSLGLLPELEQLHLEH